MITGGLSDVVIVSGRASTGNGTWRINQRFPELASAEKQAKETGKPPRKPGKKQREQVMVESDIKKVRRQPYITQKAYEGTLQRFNADYVILNDKLEACADDPGRRSSLLHSYADHCWSTFTLNFTAGASCRELAVDLSEVVQKYERYMDECNRIPDVDYLPPLLLDDMIDTYVDYLNMLIAAVLLHREDLIPRIFLLIEETDYDGSDVVIEELQKFYMPRPEQIDEWLWEKPYDRLVDAIDSQDAAQRAKQMRAYVKAWYRQMKGKALFWSKHEQVKDSFSPYYGYWAMCAAAFTYLYDIDDASYRDEIIYPADMIDYARNMLRNPVGLEEGP